MDNGEAQTRDNSEPEEYDWGKIRRRCEEEMRRMDNNPLLLEIAQMLKVKLH